MANNIGNSHVNKIKFEKRRITVILLTIIWGLFLLINTWTESLEQVLDFESFQFKWVSTPDYKSFFYFYDFTLVHPDYVTIKLGHFIGFAIMDLLLFILLRNHKFAILVSIIFAFITEFFQLFFGRDGRFYDLIIDTLGVLSVYLLVKSIKYLNSKVS
ncbi:VanZ family protein [Bacillus sp. USDA818B3_A]|uniref:VanZ family protein n=1 Tax=Bacillus sp. USDA818B3_A TaxID=2698834 RepID=UPI0013697449|nr:VanZ family protein [Bacillus sp. USDA818B3_A]